MSVLLTHLIIITRSKRNEIIENTPHNLEILYPGMYLKKIVPDKTDDRASSSSYGTEYFLGSLRSRSSLRFLRALLLARWESEMVMTLRYFDSGLLKLRTRLQL